MSSEMDIYEFANVQVRVRVWLSQLQLLKDLQGQWDLDLVKVLYGADRNSTLESDKWRSSQEHNQKIKDTTIQMHEMMQNIKSYEESNSYINDKKDLNTTVSTTQMNFLFQPHDS